MRLPHLERLRPICATCRAAGRTAPPLVLATVVRAVGDDVLEGVLVCPDQICQREHPIVDGIAIVVPDLQAWAAHQLDAVLRRDDLSSFTESLLTDAAGPGSVLARERTNLSAYGRVHWGEFDAAEPLPAEAGFAHLFQKAMELLEDPPHGVWVDLGCSVGRATFEIARRTDDLAVGVDLSFSMLRVAERVRREGSAVFPMRQLGMVFDRRELAISSFPTDRLSFWCCDVGVLPFADAAFDGALSFNVLDCVPSPIGHLMELGRILRGRAPALLSSPYDWSVEATPVQQWLGGHSQRSDDHGSSASRLRCILAADASASTGVDTRLTIKAECERVPWRVYIHERASIDYEVDLLRLERSD